MPEWGVVFSFHVVQRAENERLPQAAELQGASCFVRRVIIYLLCLLIFKRVGLWCHFLCCSTLWETLPKICMGYERGTLCVQSLLPITP